MNMAASDIEDDKGQALPELTDGELGRVTSIKLLSKETRAPAPYSEATLLGDMEGAGKYVEDAELRKVLKQVSGLGTAATRDSIIEALKHHKYLEKSGKHIVATQKGLDFITWLDVVCPELTDVAITARWEAELDVVATKGGGSDFERAIARKVEQVVSILKSQPSMAGAGIRNNSTEKASMSEEKRVNKPSDKMLEFAKNIANKLGTKLPEAVANDWEECKRYIDENKDNASRPSDKQLNFAKMIADRKGVTIPDDVAKNGRLLSKWIDDNK
jgi:DNA topoisomerase III